MSAASLAWSDFVLDLRDLLLRREVKTRLVIVGGAVRDACLGAPITDIDIAVDGDAIRMARQTADWLAADIYVMDRERGVARVFVDDAGERVLLDFARFRGDSLEEDLRARDFTVNAMAVDLLGDLSRLIDPLHGERDLRGKVLRQCSSEAFADDPLRTLRALRQSAQLGLKIHPATLTDLRKQVHNLSQISPERLRDEFFKLLSLERATPGIRVALRLGLLRQILPFLPEPADPAWTLRLHIVERTGAIISGISEKRSDNTAAAFDLGMLVMQLDRFRARLQDHLARQSGNGRRHQELLKLAALLHDPLAERDKSRQLAKVTMDALKLTVDESRRLASMLAGCRQVAAQTAWTDLERLRFWRRLGEDGIDAALLGLARTLGIQGAALDQADWLKLVENAIMLLDAFFHRHDEIVAPTLLLNGGEIMRLLGIRQGRVVGELLDGLREAQVTRRVHTLDEARDYIRRAYHSRETSAGAASTKA